jgi:hypothetical protein
MIITIDTEHPPTPLEFKHLGSLLYDIDPDANPFTADQTERQALAEMAEEELSAPPKKRRQTPAKKVSTEQTVQQQAIALATRLVSEDKTDVVRAALTSIGESRVSLLTEEQAAAFLEAVGE